MVPKQYPLEHYLIVCNMLPLGVLFRCPCDPGVLFHKHDNSAPPVRGIILAPLSKKKCSTFQSGTIFQNGSEPWSRSRVEPYWLHLFSQRCEFIKQTSFWSMWRKRRRKKRRLPESFTDIDISISCD